MTSWCKFFCVFFGEFSSSSSFNSVSGFLELSLFIVEREKREEKKKRSQSWGISKQEIKMLQWFCENHRSKSNDFQIFFFLFLSLCLPISSILILPPSSFRSPFHSSEMKLLILTYVLINMKTAVKNNNENPFMKTNCHLNNTTKEGKKKIYKFLFFLHLLYILISYPSDFRLVNNFFFFCFVVLLLFLLLFLYPLTYLLLSHRSLTHSFREKGMWRAVVVKYVMAAGKHYSSARLISSNIWKIYFNAKTGRRGSEWKRVLKWRWVDWTSQLCRD